MLTPEQIQKRKALGLADDATELEVANAEKSQSTADVTNIKDAADRKGKTRFALEYPVTTKDDTGEDVVTSELWMRRPVLFDKVVAERQAKDASSYEATAIMLGNVCEVATDVIWELDEELDLVNLVAAFNAMEEPPEIDGENTLVLRYPFTINDEEVKTLTLRRPRARDTLEFKDEQLGEKIARLCGYRQSDFNKMDLKSDWMGLENIYLSFRKRKPKR